jgi:hypothetical protein
MKRVLSLLILVAFLSAQVAPAYGQHVTFSGSLPPAATAGHRRINVNKASDDAAATADKRREEAIYEALVEAEHAAFGDEYDAADKSDLKTDASYIGKRERDIIEKGRAKASPGYQSGRKLSLKEQMRSRRGDAEPEQPFRRIKVRGDIPDDAELGQGITRQVNERIYPFKISGEYQMSWGYDWGDADSEGQRGIWKSADFNDANLVYVLDNQYIFGNHRENTYDKRIYDRFRMKLESVRETGFNILSEVVIDPWSFVGKTDTIVVTGSNGNQMPLELRYWSNSQHTLDQRVVLSSGTDYINVPEIKVNDGSTHATSITSRWANEVFNLPPMDINRDFRPVRKLEVNYTSDNLSYKIFPLADHDHAYTSDDPLILSNKHKYWEASPWLWNWKPGQYYGPSNDFMRGKWTDDISFESRDSDFNFLTLLRGMSFDFNYGGTYFSGGTAAPLNLWQDYGNVNSLPGAFRLKQYLFPGKEFYAGGIYSYNYGFDGGHVDAVNQVFAIDAGFEMPGFTKLRGEFAWSYEKTDAHGNDPNITPSYNRGQAFRIESSSEHFKDRGGNPQMKVSSSYTHMGDGFRARTSSFKNTKYDEFWGKHISFHEIDPNFAAVRIGDGIDAGRDVYNFRMEHMLFSGVVNSLYDMRFVRGDRGRKVEDVYREELTVKPLDNLTTKFLFRYQDIPNTAINRDPYILEDFISEDNTGEGIFNVDILPGLDADVYTWSGGFHYDPADWFGFEGIYERTNDYETFPNRVLTDTGFADLGDTREFNYFGFSQPLIAIPPYDPYNIYKASIFYRPMDTLRFKFDYVINEFKHATGRDDNISHWGVEVDADITSQLTASFKYTRSQLVDLFRQQQMGEDLPFNHHNNVFGEIKYALNDNNTLIAQFGEFFVPTSYTPVAWILNTVNTQRIVRLYFKGTF